MPKVKQLKEKSMRIAQALVLLLVCVEASARGYSHGHSHGKIGLLGLLFWPVLIAVIVICWGSKKRR